MVQGTEEPMRGARRPWQPWGSAALLAAALMPAAWAQNAAQAIAMPAAPKAQAAQLKVNPALAMREWEPPVDAPYTLGRGDAITIDFAGRPELASKQLIGPDGMVSFPQVGSVKVDGLTREQAAAVIAAAVDRIYDDLTVTVGVERYGSNKVLLLGAVERPGIQEFDTTPTLLEVVTRGGGVLGNAARNPSRADYTVGTTPAPSVIGVPERCAIYRGADKVLWVDLKPLLDSGSPLANMRLMRNDIVYVPSPSETYISVLGSVQHPGAVRLETGMTLDKLLSLTGGLTDSAGRYPDIQVVSPSTGQTRVYNMRAVLSPAPLDLTLHSGDIVYVPERKLAKFGYEMQQIAPLVTMFTAAALFDR
jgi:polysaccharide biosynthesis/export protein